jgi:hypothetical protein
MKLTGHKTETVYRRYAIVAESDLRDAGTKLTAVLGTTPDSGPLSDNSGGQLGDSAESASPKCQKTGGQGRD